jgi:N-acetylneuraminic acid mutarotase
MYLEIEFEEQDNSFDLEFEQVTEISDGGFDRGYAEGYENGKGDGLTEGYAKGETDGFADALAKREELVVTENGEYTPSDGSTGFKKVTANIQTVDLNIAYGETEPSDTSKLWVKTSKPSSVNVSTDETVLGGEVETLPTKLSTTRNLCGCVTIGKKIYLIGGFSTLKNGTETRNDTIEVLDTETGTTSVLPMKLPLPLSRVACAAVGSKIYTFGGNAINGSVDAIYCIDTVEETLTTSPTTLNRKQSGKACVAVGNKIYVYGGEYPGFTTYDDSMYCFDTETEQLSYVCAIGIGMSGMLDSSLVAVGDKVYVLGGDAAHNGIVGYIWCVDTTTNAYTTLPVSIPTGVRSAGCKAIGANIFICGGFNGSSAQKKVYILNTVTKTISQMPFQLPFGNYGMGCAYVDGVVYLLGGYNGNARVDTVITLVGGYLIPNGELRIVPQLEENTFRLINTDALKMEIGAYRCIKCLERGYGFDVEAATYKNGAWTNI